MVFLRLLGIACCDLDLWPIDPKANQLISISTNPNTSMSKIGRNSLHWFLRYGVHKVFGTHTHTLTHSQTDRPKYSMPPAPFFNGDRDITSSSAMAERPCELSDFKKAQVNGRTDNHSLKDSHNCLRCG